MRTLTLTLGIAGPLALTLSTSMILMLAATALTVALAADGIRDLMRRTRTC